MAINKKLIHFKEKTNFDNEVANGNINDYSIVFVQDSKDISTHGSVYKSVNWAVLGLDTFTIDGVSFQFEQGMTWESWMATDYSNSETFIFSNHAGYPSFQQSSGGLYQYICKNSKYDTLITDLIIDGQEYISINSGDK